MKSRDYIDLRSPPTRPSADEMEQFAPEIFELGDTYAAITLKGSIDFDTELFLGVEAILEGESLAEVLACVTPSHPGATEANALLTAAHRRYWAS